MNPKYQILLIATLFAVIWQNTEGQQVISSTGNSLQNNTGTLTFTLGELCIDTKNNGSITLTQGFHQPKIIVTSIDNIADPALVMKVFPNPALDFVTLQIEKEEILHFSFRLYDSNGKLVSGEKVTKPETEIPFMQLPQGNYFLTILKSGKVLQTFKIVKQ